MKVLALKIVFILLAIQTKVNCQMPDFEVEFRDTNYLTQVIFEDGDSTDIWEFKDNLEKGKYIVVSNCECGKDTLMIGQFIDDKIKHGKWIEWEERMCGGEIEENGKVSRWEFFGEPEINEVTFYQNGFIKKQINYHIITGNPHIEHIYAEGSTKFNQWIEEKVWDGDDNLRWHKKINDNGKMEHTDFYKNGEVKSKGELESHGTFQEDWEYFYPNGILMAKGKFEEFGKGEVRYYTGQRIPKGEWDYWDDSGSKIAKVIFKDGEVVNCERFQNKEIPFIEIEEMINKE